MLAKKKNINLHVLRQTYDIDHNDDFFKKTKIDDNTDKAKAWI